MLYSYSRLKCFRKCPLAYRYRYIDKIEVPEFETIESFMGSRVHEVLDSFYGEILKGKVPEMDEMLGMYHGLWDRHINPGVVVNRADESVPGFRTTGARCLEDYYNSYKPFDAAVILATELKVRIDLLGDGKYNFVGYIDRLDAGCGGMYEIHDYKTGRDLPGQKKISSDEQLALYELGLRQNMREATDVELVWHFLRHGKEIRSRRSNGDMGALKESLISTVRKIEEAIVDDHFPAVRTNLCAWCDYQEVCSDVPGRKDYRQARLSSYP